MRKKVAWAFLILLAKVPLAQVALNYNLTDAILEPGGSAILPGRLDYYGSESAYIKIRLTKIAPANWDIGACTETYCFTETTTINAAPGSRTNLSVEVYPSLSASGLAKLVMTANVIGSLDTAKIEFRFAINTDWLLVNGGIPQNAKYFIEAAKNTGLQFVCVPETFVTTARALRFSNIIWFSGNEQETPINNDEMGIILISANSGIPVGLVGQNIVEGWGPNPPDYITSVFGCKYSGEGTLSVDDECDGISFDIYGGDGADNQTSPDALLVEGDAQICFRYSNGSIAGVRKETGDIKTAVLGFGIEAIPDIEMREEVLSNLVLWLSSWSVSEKPERVSNITVFPNPFNAACEIYSNTELVSILNAQGQVIDMIKTTNGKALWYPKNTGSGVYFIESEKGKKKAIYLK